MSVCFHLKSEQTANRKQHKDLMMPRSTNLLSFLSDNPGSPSKTTNLYEGLGECHGNVTNINKIPVLRSETFKFVNRHEFCYHFRTFVMLQIA